MIIKRVFLVFIITGCSFFKKDSVLLRVGDISFSESYFADRLIEKLKNVDGLHVKNNDLISLLSDQLEKELIEEGFFFLWAQKNKLKIEPSDIATFIGSQGTTSSGVPTDFIFETTPTQNLLQNHIRLQIIKNHLLASLNKSLSVSDEELQAEYKKSAPFLSGGAVRVQQILLEKEADAKAILAKLQSGSSFEGLAQKFSLSPEGSTGGTLGWLDADSSQQAAWLLQQPLGLVKKVVPGPGGFYIFKILESKKPTTQSYAQVKDSLKKTILEKKKNEAYDRWLEEQVKTVKVLSNERLIRTITSHYQETL